MIKNSTSCFKVSDSFLCPYCKSKEIIKNGRTKNGKQQYFCKKCDKRFIDYYTYNAYYPTTNETIITLTKEGLGTRSTARVLQISPTTLLKRIITIAKNIPQPTISKYKIYEVDEIRTFVKCKSQLIWIVYALERATKSVVSFYIGLRTNKTLNVVLKTLHFGEAKCIFTDGLRNYQYLIPSSVHSVKRYGTNHIERKNLTLRTHLKRLNQRTICFSRSLLVLLSLLSIYFWI